MSAVSPQHAALLAEVRQTLPVSHPLVPKIAEGISQAWDHRRVDAQRHRELESLLSTADGLIHALEDWQRGIMDWRDVESSLVETRRLVQKLRDE